MSRDNPSGNHQPDQAIIELIHVPQSRSIVDDTYVSKPGWNKVLWEPRDAKKAHHSMIHLIPEVDPLERRAHVIVSGEVQGVFFRSETQKKAWECNVKGWVRNLPDGRVEAVFQGEDEDVKKLIDFCRVGPPLATVTTVKVDWVEVTEEFKDFRILR